MGELERYGLLSLASILVLFLVLTFVGRDPEPEVEVVRAVGGGGDVLLSGTPARVGADDSRKEPVPVADRRPVQRPKSPADPVRTAPGEERHRVVMSHVVRRGETLSGIAKKYLGSSRRWPELVAANAPLDPRRLQIGQVLRIPARHRKSISGARQSGAEPATVRRAERPKSRRPQPSVRRSPEANAARHVVRSGDTLASISNRYYGDYMQWKRIWRANRKRIPDARKLEVGTILTLP